MLKVSMRKLFYEKSLSKFLNKLLVYILNSVSCRSEFEIYPSYIYGRIKCHLRAVLQDSGRKLLASGNLWAQGSILRNYKQNIQFIKVFI